MGFASPPTMQTSTLYLDEQVPFSNEFPVFCLKRLSSGGYSVQGSEIGHEIPSPPETLWVQGLPEAHSLLNRLESNGLAVVGTRTPQDRVIQWTQKLIFSLSHRELIITSGFARGIDECAHRSALEANLPTIAILGTSLRKRYPSHHHDELRWKILKAGGLIISEIGPDDLHGEFQFLRRNRLIAALSRATVIAQSAQRSGALNTAEWTQRLGRPLFAVPGFPGDPYLLGNERLLSETYARPIFSTACLSSVWLDLATPSLPSKKPKGKPRVEDNSTLAPLQGLALEILKEITEATHQQGGIDLFALQSLFCTQAKDYGLFFAALQQLIRSERIIERKGSFQINASL